MGVGRGSTSTATCPTTEPACLTELEPALAGLPFASVQRHDGYLSVTLLLERDPEGLSTQAASLLGAFPRGEGGRRLRVDVRNRHWAALVAEIAAAVHPPG